ncbi:Na+/H+ antiporter [Cellulomonas rhizosphaerae]|uniref:Na+/H+ antiporter n=1 Tax=Cellulomonas rhizosphaerae TaxID=2293719 RepID=A0A413RN43_9CELL|nr:Na+/H+ antiporter [Cellulomonas rhizosphaerae]RHA43108.1 Na+/H+ antiporter [Cellulomonas rhizosphaerae]
MFGLELVVVLGATILVCGALARRLGVAPPVLLLLGGVLLGFVPALRQAHFPPELMLLVFLPVLLYWEALTTSLREIRANFRGIALTSTLLVVATAAAVAATAHAMGVPWGPAWVLGAALAPTDATAVGALARTLPRRTVTILRAESLVNDGTALVIYGVAVGVTVGEETLTAGHVAWLVVLAYGGGILVGAVVAVLGVQVRQRITDPLLSNVAILLIPFTAYLLAELIDASGVLAVVVAGLAMSQAGPRIGRADARQQTTAFWSLATFLLNASLFVLVGIEAQNAVRNLVSFDVGTAILAVVAVCGVILAVRLAFLVVSAYAIRLIDRRPSQRLRRVSNRARVVSTVAGFRGAVSLAAALAVPTTLSSGEAFPDRDLIVFVTAGVVATTLVVQGLLLAPAARWAHLPADDRIAGERQLADESATQEALAAMDDVAEQLGTDREVVDRLREEYDEHLRVLRARSSDDEETDPAVRYDEQYSALRLALLGHKRAAVVRLRDERRIDDIVLRQVQARLDIEELRLARGEPATE